MADLIARASTETEMPARQPGVRERPLLRVAGEFQAAEHGVAMVSGGIMADCGAIQETETGPCAFGEDEDCPVDRLDELQRMEEAPGNGNRGATHRKLPTRDASRPLSILLNHAIQLRHGSPIAGRPNPSSSRVEWGTLTPPAPARQRRGSRYRMASLGLRRWRPLYPPDWII